MRCKQCHKKVHPDDIYCIWCGAPLRGRVVAEPWERENRETPRQLPAAGSLPGRRRNSAPVTRPKRRRGGRNPLAVFLRVWIIAALLIVLPVLFAAVAEPDRQPEPMPERLQTEPRQWIPLGELEGITVAAHRIRLEEASMVIEMDFTAENRTDRDLYCSDLRVFADGTGLDSIVYFDLEAGQQTEDTLWIDAAALQALGRRRVEELTLSFGFTEEDTYEFVGWTEPVVLKLDLEAPELPIQRLHVPLLSDGDFRAALVGSLPEPAWQQMTLYLHLENSTDAPVSLQIQDAVCGDADLPLFYYITVPANTVMVTQIIPYDIPFAPGNNMELRFPLECIPENSPDPVSRTALILTVDDTGTVLDARAE